MRSQNAGKMGVGGLLHKEGERQNFDVMPPETERLGGNSWRDETTPLGFGVAHEGGGGKKV